MTMTKTAFDKIADESGYAIFLDDIRDPPPGRSWVVARSFEEAVAAVQQNGMPTYVSFDHDLGTQECGAVRNSGYDFARWLTEQDMDNGNLPHNFEYFVHSANPIGAENIRGLMSNYLRVSRGG